MIAYVLLLNPIVKLRLRQALTAPTPIQTIKIFNHHTPFRLKRVPLNLS
jgi:hypothetical protein